MSQPKSEVKLLLYSFLFQDMVYAYLICPSVKPI